MSSGTEIGRASAGDSWRSARPRRRSAGALLRWLLVLGAAHAAMGAHLPPAYAAEPSSPAPTAPAPAAAPTVEEWLNQTVRLRESVEAMSLPAAGGKPAGEIRAGAEIKAIGLVAGKQWVEIELPDRSRAFVPRAAIEYETGGSPAAPPPPEPSGAVTPTAATAQGAPETVRGTVARVPNAATLVVGDRRLRLSGVDPGPSAVLGPFESWVRGQGELVCEADAQTARYRCFTGGGVDVAEAAILNGAGRVGDGATPEYRASEAQARQQKRGLWGQP